MVAGVVNQASGTAKVPARLSVPLGLGTLLQPLNSSMIAVALVQIGVVFGAGAATSWLVSGLYLATAVASPAAGRLADMFGARRVYLGGLVLVVLASVLAPLAPGIGWLVASRVLLGLGTGAQYPAGMAIIRAAADKRGASPVGALGVLLLCAQVAVAFGPTIGGLLVGGLGWPAIFLVNLPLAVVAGVFVWVLVPADRPLERARWSDRLRALDPVGMVLFGGAMVALLLVLIQLAEAMRWWIWPVLLAAVVLAVVLAWWERRVDRPFLDVRLLASSPALSLTYVRTIVTWTAFYSVFFSFPMWLEEVRRLPVAVVGGVMLPIALTASLMLLVATRLSRRYGARPLLLIGAVGLLVVGLALAFVARADVAIWVLPVLGAVFGIPNAFNNLGNQASLYAFAPAAEMGAASGLLRTSQYVGASLASVVLALAFAGSASDSGMRLIGMVVGVLSVILLVDAATTKRV